MSVTDSGEVALLQERVRDLRRSEEKARNECMALERLLQHSKLQRKVRLRGHFLSE